MVGLWNITPSTSNARLHCFHAWESVGGARTSCLKNVQVYFACRKQSLAIASPQKVTVWCALPISSYVAVRCLLGKEKVMWSPLPACFLRGITFRTFFYEGNLLDPPFVFPLWESWHGQVLIGTHFCLCRLLYPGMKQRWGKPLPINGLPHGAAWITVER